jgi:putative transposase
MPNYRRIKIKGGTYFLTLVTYKRRNIFYSSQARQLLLDSINHVKEIHPFYLMAYCILPNHIHLLWQMQEDDSNYSTKIAEIKKLFSKWYTNEFGSLRMVNPSTAKRGESGLWQRRFWEHYIRDEVDLHRHIDYIHFNPVHHGLVARVKDWPSSSFFNYVQSGVYELDWGEGYKVDQEKFNFGE